MFLGGYGMVQMRIVARECYAVKYAKPKTSDKVKHKMRNERD